MQTQIIKLNSFRPGSQTICRILFFTIFLPWTFLILHGETQSQDLSQPWDLNRCISWATDNHLQVQKARLQNGEQSEYLKQAKASRYPDLSVQFSQSLTNDQMKDQLTGDYTDQQYNAGNFSLGASVTLFNGNKINNTITQQELSLQASQLAVEVAQNSIEISVTQAYLNLLYANESVKQAEQTLEGSGVQLEWAQSHYDAGSMAEADFARIQSQYATDAYSLTVAQNEMARHILRLKQLLELELGQEMQVDFPEIADSLVFQEIPREADVYRKALETMPEIEGSQVSVKAAQVDLKLANAGYWPELSANVGAGTGYNTLSTDGFGVQMDRGLNEYAGLSLNIPIYSGRTNKTARAVARINIAQSNLSLEESRKTLLESVENVWLDALSGQKRFQVAGEQLKASEISYRLTEEQFNLGLKNSVDLITAKNDFLVAQQEFIQAKYSAILNFKLLDFYQGKSIVL
ncbi:MAG: TolC family protein [Bacteroidales bacterium]|nr:TolC family protein [Bacteroidales bacterium]